MRSAKRGKGIRIVRFWAIALPAMMLACSHAAAVGHLEDLPFTSLEKEREVKAIRQHLRDDPDDARARWRLVRIFLEEYFFESAVAELKTIVKRDPDSPRAYQALASVHVRSPSTDYGSAIKVLKEAMDLFPHYTAIRVQLASMQIEIGQDDSAYEECQEAIAQKAPHDILAAAHLLLADIYRRRGQDDSARKHYEKAIKLHPDIMSESNGPVLIPLYTGDLLPEFMKYQTSHPATTRRLQLLDSIMRQKGG